MVLTHKYNGRMPLLTGIANVLSSSLRIHEMPVLAFSVVPNLINSGFL